MIVSSITVPLLGMVDTAVMGHLDDPVFLAAVAAGATIFTVLFMGLNFLRMGTTGITAQAFGARDNDAVREALGLSLVTAIALSLLIIVAQSLIGDVSLALLAPSERVDALTREYFAIRVWSAPASLWNFVMIGWLIGMQNARGPLAIMVATNTVNIILDLVFVVGLGMQVDGVALATVLAEICGASVGLLFVFRELRSHPGSGESVRFLEPSAYRRLFSVNSNLFVRTMALMFVFAFITAQGARMGDVILATNALLMNFQFFLSYALDGIAYAAEALVGKAVGARDRSGLLLAVRRSLQWSLLFAAGFFVAYALAGKLIIDLLSDIDPLRTAAREYLPWLIVSPLISVWSFLYDGVFVGATRSREMMLIMVGSMLLIFLPTWFGFAYLGNHGLWLAFTLFMAARGIGMHAWFSRLVGNDAFEFSR
ncbi:MAG: MATE family efflux transporter [Gammaproteobacteria bacterium]|nr:MATE family efflux transporter [Gammaproteobacteria bacterium]MBT8445307.1 MATE family efflux transporter [Gammaproteobacteria bacterium]NND36612.1 MATE family efflux transporter [Gammaproteobacteria bacterium]